MRAVLCVAVVTACSSSPGDGNPTTEPDASTVDAPPLGEGIVMLDSGPVRGTTEDGALVWRGIPYAAAPVHALRWRAPAPPVPWTEIRDATVFGNMCLQTGPAGLVGDEDCLFLNVWVPPTHDGPLPVIVFAHGGDWILGAGSQPLYDGAYLAVHGSAIVVTINYRLGALGFLAHPALAAEDPNASTGNYGLLDQVAALQWVQRNAAVFGGDPTRVVFWGQSAGAWSALMHVASPVGRDLFSRAIAESGGLFVRPLAAAESNGTAYASQLGCGTAPDIVACMRALPGSTVAVPPPQTAWDPTIDGYVLTQPVITSLLAGDHAKVPLIIGDTAAEYAGGLLAAPVPIASVTTEADYEAALQQLFPVNATTVLAHYPASVYPSVRAAYVAALDDAFMLCPARRVARAMSTTQSQPVWRYIDAHADSSGALSTKGASHAVDLPFWFHTFSAVKDFLPTFGEYALSDTLVVSLGRFAQTGDPNPTVAPYWTRYDATDPYVQLDDIIGAGAGYHPNNCDYWDSF